MRFLPDMNAVVELLRGPGGPMLRRIRSHHPSEIGLSAVALHELYYGAFRSNRRDQNVALIDRLRFEVVEFEGEDGRHAGEIRAELVQGGTSIGPYNALVAGQARARELTLVTAYLGEFQRVQGG
jgi:tRNA(fMet)-specific endonuclease VapC